MAISGVFLSALFCVLVHTALAQKPECPFNLDVCDWEPWSEWSPCSRTCGDGTKTRSRGLCCNVGEEFDFCYKSCNLTEDAIETVKCGTVCPIGNCTYTEVKDTGIEATNFQLLYNADNNVINPVVRLKSDEEFCAYSCQQASQDDGLFCWGYTIDASGECLLHFYTKPLSVANSSLVGQAPGQSIYIRSCEEKVKCQATSADIVLVVDSSGSIGSENFQKIKIFLQSLVNGMDIDPDLTRVSILTFNDDSKWIFKLGDLNTKNEVLEAIQRIQYVIGGTKTGEALNTVRTEGFVNNRTDQGVPLITVVITDGLSRYPPLTRFQASLLRREGVSLYSIGVGGYANHEELFNIASSPEEKNMFEFGDFDVLNAANITLPVNYVACKEVIQTTTPGVTLTTTASDCFDTEDNCQLYGQDVCTDYEPWARAHCNKFCGFCGPPVSTKPPKCEDKIPNCASFGVYYCQNKEFINWVSTNCPKFCGLCTGPTTERPITTPSTVPTTTVSICRDTIENCDDYLSSCDDPKFQGFLQARCSATCGFCQSHKIVNGTQVNGKECPEWYIPSECTVETEDPNCCPIPRCPNANYIYTSEFVRS